jgi:hypothetical protein
VLGRSIGIAAAAVTAALGIAACGGGSGSTSNAPTPNVVETSAAQPTPEPAQPAAPEAKASGGFSGQDATNYENAKAACELPKSQVAKEVGLEPDAEPSDIAQAYSQGYRGSFQQAVLEGCLAGLK